MYYKIIKWLSKNEYELKARYIPALIFMIVLEFAIINKYFYELDLGWLSMLKIPLLIISSLFLALLPKFCSVIISGYLQTLFWDKYGNTTILYIKKSKKPSFQKLLKLYDNSDSLLNNMLKATRDDRKLFSKNIFYGFMRNFSFLILCFLLINIIYFNYFIFTNIIILVVTLFCLYIASQRYAEQIIMSYIEHKAFE